MHLKTGIKIRVVKIRAVSRTMGAEVHPEGSVTAADKPREV